jgi:carboxypeptidase Q
MPIRGMNMLTTIRSCALLLAAALAAPALHAADTAPLAPMPLQKSLNPLVGEVYVSGQGGVCLEALADGIGARLTGSPAYDAAVRWAVAQFHAMGIADVHPESVPLPHGWTRGAARARLLTGTERALHVMSYGWSPPTPGKGLRAPVVMLEDVSDAGLAAAHVRGAIVLIDRKTLLGAAVFRRVTEEEWQRDLLTETLDSRLHAAGAVAALIYSGLPNQVLRTSDSRDGAEVLDLPIASIGTEDGLLLRRLLVKGRVEIELSLENTVQGPITATNVIAEIPGRELPNEYVMLGAHLDSWDLATGAQDNGSGVCQVMDVARAVAALGQKPRRTLRFALWASEEQGLNGSLAYVRAHAAEMPRIVVYLNTDSGAGRPLGWNVASNPALQAALTPLLPLFERLGGNAFTQDIAFDTDSGGFFLAGVPSLNLEVVDTEYDAVVHHKAADTLDKVDGHDLTSGTAMLAVAGWAFAESETRAVAHLPGPAVRNVLKANGALGYVEATPLRSLLHD